MPCTCLHINATFRFTCPVTGYPIDGTYDDATGRLDLTPDPPIESTTEQRADCITWCIRSDWSAYLSWSDARLKLIARGVKAEELCPHDRSEPC